MARGKRKKASPPEDDQYSWFQDFLGECAVSVKARKLSRKEFIAEYGRRAVRHKILMNVRAFLIRKNQNYNPENYVVLQNFDRHYSRFEREARGVGIRHEVWRSGEAHDTVRDARGRFAEYGGKYEGERG